MIEIYNYSQGQEDFLILRLSDRNDKHNKAINIMFDGGNSELRCEDVVRKQINEPIDYIVVTHIDNDHLKGIVRLLEKSEEELEMKNKLKNTIIIYNRFINGEVSYACAESLENTLKGRKVINSYCEYQHNSGNVIFLSVEQRLMYKFLQKDKAYITFLSPTNRNVIKNLYENYTYYKNQGKNPSSNRCIVNKSSIMCLLEYGNSCVLMTGDGFLSDIKKPLSRLMDEKEIVCPICSVDNRVFKFPHHGSEVNNRELNDILDIFPCNKFILTNVEASKINGLKAGNVKVSDVILELSKTKEVYSNCNYEGLVNKKMEKLTVG